MTEYIKIKKEVATEIQSKLAAIEKASALISDYESLRGENDVLRETLRLVKEGKINPAACVDKANEFLLDTEKLADFQKAADNNTKQVGTLTDTAVSNSGDLNQFSNYEPDMPGTFGPQGGLYEKHRKGASLDRQGKFNMRIAQENAENKFYNDVLGI